MGAIALLALLGLHIEVLCGVGGVGTELGGDGLGVGVGMKWKGGWSDSE